MLRGPGAPLVRDEIAGTPLVADRRCRMVVAGARAAIRRRGSRRQDPGQRSAWACRTPNSSTTSQHAATVLLLLRLRA
eukprot:15431978-Alexandrium_andersonii.AAC.1